MLEIIDFCNLDLKETEMKQLALTLALCFAFAVASCADRYSDLCDV
jgi:hypothetical protein